MAKNNERLTLLLLKLDAIIKRQEYFSNEINDLRQEINFLKTAETEEEKDFEEKQTTEDDKSVDNEAIRVIKLIPLEFLPEYKNGKPVASEFKIPVYFTLQN